MPGSQMMRRRLARKLVKLREAAGLSQEDAAKKIGKRGSTLSRIEACRIAASASDVRWLCEVYGADDIRDTLVEWTQAATVRSGWWEEFADLLPDWMRLYVELEDAASRLLISETTLVHGLLQTADYAAAVFRTGQETAPEAVQQHVDLRLCRQRAILDREHPPSITAVLDEAVLTRPVGGPGVLDAQIDHLHALTARPDGARIDVRIVPFVAGAHAAMSGSFTLLEFDDPDDPDAVHLEQQVGAMYLEEEDAKPDSPVNEYRRIHALIRDQSIPINEWRGK